MDDLVSPINIGQGQVFHSRKEGVSRSFSYPSFFVLFECDKELELQSTMSHRFYNFLSMTAQDYLKKEGGSFSSNIKRFLIEQCSYQADSVWLHTMPRMFGYAFNPVSFWLCYRKEKLEAVLVEVHNTFGEAHFYWVQPEFGIAADKWYDVEKVFHVSPFFPVEGFYKFRFQFENQSARVDINYYSPEGPLRLATWVKGALSPLDSSSFMALLLRYGWITPMVVVRIHFQAFKLWLHKMRFYSKPALPKQEVTK